MSKLLNNVGLLGTAVILSFAPVLIFQGKEFKATDSRNQTAIEEVKPGYKPWAAPIIKPSGGEIETFLFSAQAAIGSGIVCYILGLYKGRSERKQSDKIVESIEHRDW
jgi:cobalt/nickel transport protein